MKRIASTLMPLVCLVGYGCGGVNESYLPRPRLPEPESEPKPAARATPPRAGRTVSSPKSPSGSPAPTPPPPAASGTVPPAPAASPAPKAGYSQANGRRRVVEQLMRIGEAFEAYRRENGRYPNRSMFAGGLSWRVAMLRYLGQSDLPIDKDEPWTHPTNQALRTRIPDGFKPAASRDGKTNLVLFTGPETAYPTGRGLSAEECPDGLENTILVVEIDDAHAVRGWHRKTMRSREIPCMKHCSESITTAATPCSAGRRAFAAFRPPSRTNSCSRSSRLQAARRFRPSTSRGHQRRNRMKNCFST